MKKKVVVITVVVLIILIVSALILYFNEDYSNVNVKTADMLSNITIELDDDMPTMISLTEEEVIEKYNLDIAKIEEYTIQVPIMNVRSDEIAIVKVNTLFEVEYIKNKFKERVKLIQNEFDGYLQDQFELAKNPLIISKGRYIMMSISDRNDDIENIFKSYFNNK